MGEDEPRIAVWDGSDWVTWSLATFTAALAAYIASSEHHKQDRRVEADDDAPQQDVPAVASATLDSVSAVAFLAMASMGLLVLYFLIQWGFSSVTTLLNVMFTLAAGTSSSQVFFVPLVALLTPRALKATFDRLITVRRISTRSMEECGMRDICCVRLHM
jgi:hypothetical protein